jgi:hypothetical protein
MTTKEPTRCFGCGTKATLRVFDKEQDYGPESTGLPHYWCASCAIRTAILDGWFDPDKKNRFDISQTLESVEKAA